MSKREDIHTILDKTMNFNEKDVEKVMSSQETNKEKTLYTIYYSLYINDTWIKDILANQRLYYGYMKEPSETTVDHFSSLKEFKKSRWWLVFPLNISMLRRDIWFKYKTLRIKIKDIRSIKVTSLQKKVTPMFF